MTATTEHTYRRRGLYPLHGVLLAGTLALFLAAALSDYAYATTYQIQWATFSSWLIAGALVCNGLALVFAILGLVRADGRRRPALVYGALLVVSWVLGFINALAHARDAWAMMPTGLVLSIIVAVLVIVATWIGFSNTGVKARQ